MSESNLESNPKPTTNFNNIIRQYVKLLQTKMEGDDFIFLKKYHPIDYEQKLSDFVPTFKEEYPHLFKMIISGADLNILEMFLNNMSDIDNGNKTLNDARAEMGNMLHDKYVKSKLKQ